MKFIQRWWCALRGHGGLTPVGRSVLFGNWAQCKRCGSAVKLYRGSFNE